MKIFRCGSIRACNVKVFQQNIYKAELQRMFRPLWCFLHTEKFEAAILKAANLGDDTDGTAAICGQVTGAFYGNRGEDRISERSFKTRYDLI